MHLILNFCCCASSTRWQWVSVSIRTKTTSLILTGPAFRSLSPFRPCNNLGTGKLGSPTFSPHWSFERNSVAKPLVFFICSSSYRRPRVGAPLTWGECHKFDSRSWIYRVVRGYCTRTFRNREDERTRKLFKMCAPREDVKNVKIDNFSEINSIQSVSWRCIRHDRFLKLFTVVGVL